MPAQTPKQTHELFLELFNAADIDQLLALYEPTATFVPADGEPVSGHDSIRQQLEGFLALKRHMTLTVNKVFQSNDIGLLFSSWRLEATDSAGEPIVVQGKTSDVVRRQANGSWLFVIDNPQGASGDQALPQK